MKNVVHKRFLFSLQGLLHLCVHLRATVLTVCAFILLHYETKLHQSSWQLQRPFCNVHVPMQSPEFGC